MDSGWGPEGIEVAVAARIIKGVGEASRLAAGLAQMADPVTSLALRAERGAKQPGERAIVGGIAVVITAYRACSPASE